MTLMYWVTVVILAFAITGSGNLSRKDWKKKDICPKILGMPACYIVFAFFLAAGVAHYLNTPVSNQAYFGLVAVPALIALVGTVTELSGKVICPRTGSGTPMCYISLGLCLSLLLTKYLSL